MSRNRVSQIFSLWLYYDTSVRVFEIASVYCEQNLISIGAITSLSIFYFKDKSFLTPFPIPLGIVGTKYDIYQVRAFSATNKTSFHYSVQFFCMKRQLYRVYKKNETFRNQTLVGIWIHSTMLNPGGIKRNRSEFYAWRSYLKLKFGFVQHMIMYSLRHRLKRGTSLSLWRRLDHVLIN
jgi:hypothetical protein